MLLTPKMEDVMCAIKYRIYKWPFDCSTWPSAFFLLCRCHPGILGQHFKVRLAHRNTNDRQKYNLSEARSLEMEVLTFGKGQFTLSSIGGILKVKSIDQKILSNHSSFYI